VRTGLLRTSAVDVAYDDTGEGSPPPLLLLHGFSCARSDFVHQMAAFSPRHRVVAFDQRGHGDSSLARDGRYGLEATVDDAVALCAALGIEEPVVVVGHSLGGVSALRLAARPGFAAGLVLLDSTIEIPPPVQAELLAYAERLDGLSNAEFAEEIRQYARGRMIDPNDDAAVAAELVERSARVSKDAYLTGVRSILGVDVAALAETVTVPALFIASSMPWLRPERVHELAPRWHLGRTVGAGHFHHLLVPDQVNAMIRRFLDCVARGGAEAAPSEW
jgi:pimeloyl-ACP methyl ester carboxylesterase